MLFKFVLYNSISSPIGCETCNESLNAVIVKNILLYNQGKFHEAAENFSQVLLIGDNIEAM
jgi:hypothetical protein